MDGDGILEGGSVDESMSGDTRNCVVVIGRRKGRCSARVVIDRGGRNK